jgi:hypothetical protein
MLHDLQGLGSLTKIWRSLSDTWDSSDRLPYYRGNNIKGESGHVT